jgi:hypothetical protein
LPDYIAQSTDIEDPRSYIAGYNDSTASDHLPVYSRFAFAAPLTINATVAGNTVQVTWESDLHNTLFVVERAADSLHFQDIGQVHSGSGSYSFTDNEPLRGTGYYRLRTISGETVHYSNIDSVFIRDDQPKPVLTICPNPARNFGLIVLPGAGAQKFRMQVSNIAGHAVMRGNGNLVELNLVFNRQLWKLKPGVYVMKLDSKTEHYMVKFLKL